MILLAVRAKGMFITKIFLADSAISCSGEISAGEPAKGDTLILVKP